MSDKRTQLIEAAIDLFATNGFWNTPTSKITKHAGVSTGTLFNYFASKDALIDAVYVQLRHEQMEHVAQGFPEKGTVQSGMEHMWFRYIDWGVLNPVRYSLLRQMKLSNMVSEEAQQSALAEMTFAAELISRAFAEGVLENVSPDYFSHLVLAQLEASVSFAMANNLRDMPLAKHINRSFEIFWAGVTS